MRDLKEIFLVYLEMEKHYSLHTIRSLDRSLEYFFNFTGTRDYFAIKEKHIRDWIVSMSDKGHKPASVHTRVSAVKSFYKYLLRMQYIDKLPWAELALPKIRKKLVKYLTVEQMDELLDGDYYLDNFIGIRDKFMIHMLYYTGIRCAELRMMRISDYRKGDHTIKVKGKGNKERVVPFAPVLDDLYDKYMKVRSDVSNADKEALFITSSGAAVYDTLIFRKIKFYIYLATGISDGSPHWLRHTYATHLINNGASILAIQNLLGHSNVKTTEIYTSVDFERKKKLIEGIMDRRSK